MPDRYLGAAIGRLKFGVMALFAAIAAIYFFLLFQFGTNTPVEDEFYGTFYYHYLLGKASISEKLELLFFQHSQHKAIINRLLYYVELFLLGRIDLFYEMVIGNIILLSTPFLVWWLVKPEANKNPYLFVLPLLYFLNFSLWYPNFWGGGSIASNLSLVLALSICLLVRQSSKVSLISGLALLFLLTFAYANGVLMVVISCAHILFSNRKKQEKAIWIWFSFFIALVYLITFDYAAYASGGFVVGHQLEEKMLTLTKVIYLAPIGFLMLVGSAPFPLVAPAWIGALTGAIIVFLLYKMLVFYWKNNKSIFYALVASILYCMMTFALISIIRIPWSGIQVAYGSHFKIYSLYLFSIISVFFGMRIKSRSVFIIFISIMTIIPIQSSIYHFPIMLKNQKDKRERITDWSLNGTRSSLGENGRWFPLGEQMLFVAWESGLYSPFHTTRGALDQMKSIEAINDCPMGGDINTVSSEIFYKKGAIAASISLDDEKFDEVLLCSNEEGFKLLPVMDFAQRIVFEKKHIPKGVYYIYFKSGGKLLGRSNAVLDMLGEKTRMPCEPVWAPTFKIYDRIKKDICKKVFK